MSRNRQGIIGVRAIGAAVAILGAACMADQALAFTYTSGDVLYVAYQSPTGPNYIVNLGPRANFTGAVTTITLPDVTASDLNGVIGASAANIFVGLFGVLNPSTRDGILGANGPVDDFALGTANVIGAVNQIDSFGNNVVAFSLAVPSANPRAGRFAGSGSAGSYQSTLNAVNAGSLGNNIGWSVETMLSNAAGTRIATAVKIPFFRAIRNTFSGVQSRAVIGFFTLSPNGTVTYSPDADGDLIADEADLCPGVTSSDNSDTDGDHHAPACDCNTANAAVWAIPGEVPSLSFNTNTDFAWTAPGAPGGTAPQYDVLRSLTAGSGSGGAPSYACLLTNQAVLTGSDAVAPPIGRAQFYVARAGNACGEGLAGTMTGGAPIAAPACP